MAFAARCTTTRPRSPRRRTIAPSMPIGLCAARCTIRRNRPPLPVRGRWKTTDMAPCQPGARVDSERDKGQSRGRTYRSRRRHRTDLRPEVSATAIGIGFGTGARNPYRRSALDSATAISHWVRHRPRRRIRHGPSAADSLSGLGIAHRRRYRYRHRSPASASA